MGFVFAPPWVFSLLVFEHKKTQQKNTEKMAGEGKKSFHEWFDGMEIYKHKQEAAPRHRSLNCPQVFVLFCFVFCLFFVCFCFFVLFCFLFLFFGFVCCFGFVSLFVVCLLFVCWLFVVHLFCLSFPSRFCFFFSDSPLFSSFSFF